MIWRNGLVSWKTRVEEITDAEQEKGKKERRTV